MSIWSIAGFGLLGIFAGVLILILTVIGLKALFPAERRRKKSDAESGGGNGETESR